MHMCILRHVQLFVTLWTVAQQAPLSMGFPRQENQNGLPFPIPGDLHDSETKPTFPVSLALASDSLLLLHLNLTARCDTSQLSLINVLTYIVIVFIPLTKKKK